MKKQLSVLLCAIAFSLHVNAGASNEALWSALLNLDTDGVKTALAAGADPNAPHASLGSPLNYAASFGDAEMIKALLAAKAVVDAEHPANKYTPLLSAAAWGNEAGVRLLIEAGANVNKSVQVGNVLTNAFSSGNGEIIKMLVEAGADVKKTFPTIGGEWPAAVFFVMMYKAPEERMEYIESVKPAMQNIGVSKLPEWLTNPSFESMMPLQQVMEVLVKAGMDVNAPQTFAGTKIKKSPLAIAYEFEKQEMVEALIAAGADKGGPGVKEAIAVVKANNKPTPFNESSANASKIKVMFDFPREGRNSDNGSGYSANISLLKEKPKRVALVSYYLYDAGKGKAKLNTAVWRTPDYTGQTQVNAFYSKSIEPLKAAFKENGIELLTPEEFLDTEEKAELYYGFVQETAKREKTTITKTKTRSTTSYGYYFNTTTYRTTTATTSTLKVCPAGAGYRAFFVANEEEDESSVSNFQGGVFTANRKLTSNLGYELTKGLGVDAVLVVYIATRKPKQFQNEFGVNAVVMAMLGPNPTATENAGEEDKNRGQFYCATRTFYASPEIFQLDKAKPKVDGIENVLIAHTKKMCAYINEKEKD